MIVDAARPVRSRRSDRHGSTRDADASAFEADASASASDRDRLAPMPAAGTERRLRLVVAGTDAAAASVPAARIYVADDGGPIRTVIGADHSHFVGEEASIKTGLSNPYEGAVEYLLIRESEVRYDVLAFRTQAMRMRVMVGNTMREWICDHLRQVRVGQADVIEAIECKPDMSYLGDVGERARMTAVRKVVESLGWRFRVIYEADVLGGGERQINLGTIMAHKTKRVGDDHRAAFDLLARETTHSTFGRLRTALSDVRQEGTALAHAFICEGRVRFDLDRRLHDGSPVELLPRPSFTPRIWF
ncbi:hypothetical protein KV697_14205 [Sphingomonas sanguinis]|uniref:hypothetical protein n=1 Tax=Sphingomonas sanguinis TaxID=33051 RepID=UPI001C59BE3D|nr:hypothetical protein [Sphingomonas sanguinis]QXT34923.1 hypothetical protein KV697_14205 [Sphingomonas sanguinis]